MDFMEISNATRRIGKPKDWDEKLDGQCATIHVVDAIDPLSGHNFMYSYHKPTKEELAMLNAGGVIQLGIMGQTHPVVSLVTTFLIPTESV